MAADNHDNLNGKPTLWGALKDLGWIPVLLMGVGGFSVIDILEKAVHLNLGLVTPLQYALDGYHRITALLGAIVEPSFQTAIDWINMRSSWNAHLEPYWRSLFVLSMVYVAGVFRPFVSSRAWGQVVMYVVLLGLVALAASIAVGLLSPTAGWWGQGITATVPVVLLMTASTVAGGIHQLRSDGSTEAPVHFFVATLAVPAFGAVAFLLGALLSFVPGLSHAAGVVVLGGLIASAGACALFFGLRYDEPVTCRQGLSVLGGFVAAGLILLSNWMLTAVH